MEGTVHIIIIGHGCHWQHSLYILAKMIGLIVLNFMKGEDKKNA